MPLEINLNSRDNLFCAVSALSSCCEEEIHLLIVIHLKKLYSSSAYVNAASQ